MKPIHKEDFHHDGRGPGLMQVLWSPKGDYLKAFEYFNPEDPYDEVHVRHVKVVRPQVVMSTPEEVINYSSFQPGPHDRAAAFDCGRSEWLMSFSPRHLDRCTHFRLMFYDELYDIIAEGLEFRMGRFKETAQQTVGGAESPAPQP
jgi:hypothetical protein